MILDPVIIKSGVTLTAIVVEGGLTDDPSSVAGDAAGTGSADGSVVLDQDTAGTAGGAGVASGAVDLDQALAGGATGSGDAAGDVRDSTDQAVSGAAAGTGDAIGNVDLDQTTSGDATGAGDAAGDVSLDQGLSGAASGTGDAGGNVTTAGSPPTITGSLPDVVLTEGVAMTPVDLLSIATGATGATLIAPSSLPTGLSLNSGVLSGTPASNGAVFVSVRATNASGSSLLYGFTLEILADPQATLVENPTLAYNAGEHSYFNPQDPFLNKAKMGAPWSGQRPAQAQLEYSDLVSAGVINATGYPFQVGATGVNEFNSYFAWGDFQAGSAFAGDYVVKWDVLSGDGGSFRLTESASGYVSAGTRRLTFTYGGTGNWGLFVDPATGFPTNIRICRAEHEDLLDAGGTWDPRFLAIHHNTRELRFLDWIHANNSTWSDYAADKTPVDAFTYSPGAEITVPVEVMCDLCNVLTCDPWFTLPHLFTDQSVTDFATDVLNNLDPSLRAKFEWSNEVWNSGFDQFTYALNQSNADWGAGTDDAVGWQTKRGVECARLIDTVFVGDLTRRVNVLGGFNAIPFNTTQMLSAATWFAEEPADDIPANDPLTVFQEFAITTYFGASSDIINAGLVTAYGVSQENGDEYLHASLLDAGNETSIPDTLDLIDQHLTAISNLGGGPRLSLYEGGQHVHFESAVSPAIDAELLAFCQGDHMADLYQRIWDGLEARNVGPFMQFLDVGNSSRFGTWGLRQSLTDTTPRRVAYVEAKSRQSAQWWTDSLPAGTYTGGAAVVRDARIHGDMHSIWGHNQQFANISVWAHRMQLGEPDLDFFVGGRFLVGGTVYTDPPTWGDHAYNGAKANAYQAGGLGTWAAFEAAGITHFASTPFNFADDQTAEDDAVQRFSDRVSSITANVTTPPRFFMYRPWDDFAYYMIQNSGAPTGDTDLGEEVDFLAWRNNERASMTTFLDNVLSRTKALHPTADIFEVNVNEMLKRVLKNTALEPLRAPDLFEDNAPHGLDVLYLVAAMIVHSTIYNRPAPIDLDLTGATLPSEFTNNIEDIRDYIWAEVANAAQTPLGGTAPSSAISGAAAGIGDAAGSVSLDQAAAGDAVGAGDASGAVGLDQAIAGDAAGTGAAAGDVSTDGSISGDAAGTGDAVGDVTLDQALAGGATGSGAAAGDVAAPPAGEPERVEFPGGAGIRGIAGFTGSYTQFTMATRITPRTGIGNFEQLSTGPFEIFTAAGGGGAGERIGLNIDGNFPQADLVDGGGSPIDIEFSILLVVDGAGIAGAGGDTIRCYIDGRLAMSETSAIAAQTVLAHHGFLGGQYASGPPVGIRRIWSAYAAIDDYAAFFNADDTLRALTGTGDVSGVTPDFWQEGDAATWNSGTDQNGTAYTPESTFT